MPTVLLSFGANVPGVWGPPATSIRSAIDRLRRHNLRIIEHSKLYKTRPFGNRRQPPFMNAIARVETDLSPDALLRLAKSLERQAGRRPVGRWGPRPLDIDIVDYGGRIRRWEDRRVHHGMLTLPHRGLHGRAFVLVPLCEIAPRWRHPVLGVSAAYLLRQLRRSDRAGVTPLEPEPKSCDKPGR